MCSVNYDSDGDHEAGDAKNKLQYILGNSVILLACHWIMSTIAHRQSTQDNGALS